MKNRKSIFSTYKLKYSLLAVILLGFIFYLFRHDVFVYFSHLSHKEELNFVKKFLVDFKSADHNKLRKYFFDDKYKRVLKLLRKHDKNLYHRNYYIREISSIFYDRDKKKYLKSPDMSFLELYTINKNKFSYWLDIFIKKKEGKFFIESFQLGLDFPRPPNKLSTERGNNI